MRLLMIFVLLIALPLLATSVISLKTLGLAPDVNDLSGFSAAAGYAEAAVFQGLSDPPFVQGDW